jgi:O-antigen/teichoic acid export membrane protein
MLVADEAAKPKDSHPALKGVAKVFAGQGARLVVSLAAVLYIAEVIGPAARGRLTVLMATTSLATVILMVGLNGAATYLVGSGRWRNREATLFGLLWSLAAGVVAFACFMVLQATPAGDSMTAGLPPALLGFSTFAMTLLTMQSAVMIGTKAYGMIALITLAPAVLNVSLFLALRAGGLSPSHAALLSWALAQGAAALPFTSMYILTGSGRLRLPRSVPFAFKYGTKTGIANLFNLANLRADVLLLTWLSGPAATGAYGLAVQLSEVSWLLPTAVGTVVFPEIASRASTDAGIWTARLCRMTVVLVTCSSLIVAALGTVLFRFVMVDYASAIPLLWLLVPGMLCFAIARVLGSDLFGRARPGAHLRAAGISFVVTAVADLLLIPRLGAVAAALVSSLAYFVYAYDLGRFFRKYTGTKLTDIWIPRSRDIMDSTRMIRNTIAMYLAVGTAKGSRQ